jgi:hypothetical protein
MARDNVFLTDAEDMCQQQPRFAAGRLDSGRAQTRDSRRQHLCV